MPVSIRLLGPFELELNGRRLTSDRLRRRTAHLLLRLLALQPEQRMARAEVIEALLPANIAAPEKALYNAVYDLRTALRDDVAGAGVAMSSKVLHLDFGEPPWVDVAEFDRKLDEAQRAADVGEAAALLAEAIALYRGPLLPDLGFEDWAIAARGAYHRKAMGALRQLAQMQRARGADDAVVSTWHRMLELEPGDESVHRALMDFWAARGQRHQAMRQFQLCRQMLKAGLGAEPDAETVALAEKIRRGDTAAAAQAAGAVRAPAAPPLPAGELIGRRGDVAALVTLLCRPDTRLLSVLGAPGIGKTRLAVDVARVAGDSFADGAVWVDLAPVRDAEHVAGAIALALGLAAREGESTVDVLLRALAARRVLLVLDNAEHLLDAVPLLSDLLSRCSRLVILATSRVALRSRFERRYKLEPLATPAAGRRTVAELATVDSVRLFVARARAVQRDFDLTEANAEAVARICAAVEGIPLAIEYAAARIALLPPAALAERLTAHVNWLSTTLRDAPPRQISLAAALRWSHELLPASAQRLLARLGVFVGGFSLGAAEAVAQGGDEALTDLGAPVLDVLSTLIDAHLVQAVAAVAGDLRYSLLEMVREFAVERLTAGGEAEALGRRHAEYYAQLIEDARNRFQRSNDLHDMQAPDAELPNARAAMRWAEAHGAAATGLQIATALNPIWRAHCLVDEGMGWVQRFADRIEAAEPRPPDSLIWRAYNVIGGLATLQWDFPRAIAAFEAGVAFARAVRRPDVEGTLLMNLMGLKTDQGDVEGAEAVGREVEAVLPAIASHHTHTMIASAIRGHLAWVRLEQGDFDAAFALAQEGLRISGHSGWKDQEFSEILAHAAATRGDHGIALSLASEIWSAVAPVGDVAVALSTFELVARTVAAQGRVAVGGRLLAAAEAIRAELGAKRRPFLERVVARNDAAIIAAVPPAALPDRPPRTLAELQPLLDEALAGTIQSPALHG